MNSSSPQRSLRSSKRLSLSLSVRKTRKSENGNKTKDDPCNKQSTQASPDNLEQSPPSMNKPGNLVQTDYLEVAPRTEKSCFLNSPSSRQNLQSTETVIVLSDDDNDMQSPSKRSISEFFTPQRGKQSTAASAGKTVHKTEPKRVVKVRRKICPTTNIKMLTKKYFDDTQKRITSFFTKEENDSQRIGFCRVLKESAMPAIVTGDLDVEQLLHVAVEEGNDRLSYSQNVAESSSISPTLERDEICPNKIIERIERVESLCYDPIKEAWNMERVEVPMEIGEPCHEETLGVSGILCNARSRSPNVKNLHEDRSTCVSEVTRQTTNYPNGHTSNHVQESKTKRSQQKRRSKIVCPSYKIIAGTNFAVDAFRYGNIEGVTHYFLTHFHADHYIGLKKTFCKPLIMSPITARLVKVFINVTEECFIIIDLHQSIVIDGVEVTALDANHCPGAVMFLFRLPDATTILHTGDFRASPEMEEYPEFWNSSIDSVYLDTTYLSSKYAFKSQWESVADAREIVEAYLKKHIGTKVLVVCGSYLIGKEKVWLELAISSKMKVWTEPNRWKALKAIADPNQLSVLVADPAKADVHVLAMNKLTYDELNDHLNQFPDRYDSVIGIRPSGWEKHSKPQYRGRINIVGVEYSEHSSFDELKRFVKFLRPVEVISTVPYGNSNLHRTPSIPASWYQGEIRPHRKELQLSITRFIAPLSTKNSERLKRFTSRSEKAIKREPTKNGNPKYNLETDLGNVIELVSDDDEENIQQSENGEYSFDSDWMA